MADLLRMARFNKHAGTHKGFTFPPRERAGARATDAPRCAYGARASRQYATTCNQYASTFKKIPQHSTILHNVRQSSTWIFFSFPSSLLFPHPLVKVLFFPCSSSSPASVLWYPLARVILEPLNFYHDISYLITSCHKTSSSNTISYHNIIS